MRINNKYFFPSYALVNFVLWLMMKKFSWMNEPKNIFNIKELKEIKKETVYIYKDLTVAFCLFIST